MIAKSPVRSRTFCFGFAFGIILCGVLNYLSYLNNWCTEYIYDCYWSIGFPVAFGRGHGGGYGFDGVIFLGLITDFFFLFTASLLSGKIFMFVWSKIKTPQD
jgi:hypothetical protein